MKKRITLITSSVLFVALLLILPRQATVDGVSSRSIEPKSFGDIQLEKEGREDKNTNPRARAEFEYNQLKDPKTGKIPSMIRQKEQKFAQENLVERINGNPRFQRAQSNSTTATAEATFENFGPVHIGGRTRALAIDIADENNILAGGVSGGVWRTTDQGTSWTRTSGLTQHPAVTDIVQDTRPGKTNTWYYSTGEMLESSADLNADSYFGNGIYKSVDNGVTWSLIEATAQAGFSDSPGVTTLGDFSLVDQINIDYSNAEGTEMYAAGIGKIIRSTDGFETYSIVLGGTDNENWTDLAITSTGKVFAFIANLFPGGSTSDQGLYESTDGITWTAIDFPAGIPSTFVRGEMAIDPQNENRLYIATVTDEDLDNGVNEANLLLYDDVTDTWTDLTANMGLGNDFFNDHYTQFGYNFFLAVHPGDDQTLFLGGSNLIRTTDGFTSSDNLSKIGGYNTANQSSLYNNQHPDQHSIAFFPSDPNKMLVGTDGGIHITTDNVAPPATNTTEPVTWQDLNNGYITSQFYHAAIHQYDRLDDQIVGGMQDNSSYAKFSDETDEVWTQVLTADGAFSLITYNSLVVSTQLIGAIRRYELVGNTYANAFDISPDPSQNSAEFLFVTPITYNPVAQDQYFIASRGSVFFTNDVRENPGTGEWDRITGGSLPNNSGVSAMALSHQPEGVLYFGTRSGTMFKIDDVRNLQDGTAPEILDTSDLPAGNIAAIAVDPSDADKVVLVISNYNVRSVWQSADGGATWSSISGNLEENPDGTGNGPSVRAVAIMADDAGGNYYFVGTSVGLYMTQTLDGDNTVWTQQSPDVIGQVMISWIAARPVDGVVVASTHGNGVFKAQYDAGHVANINYSIDPQTDQIVMRANLSYDESLPFAYEWVRDGEAIPDSNGDSFTTNVTGSYQARVVRQDGMSSLSNTIDYEGDEITSIDDNLLQKIEQIVVDANPSNGVFNLAFPSEYIGDFNLSVVGADGQQKVTTAISGYNEGEQVPVDLTNLPDGLYVLNVANDLSRSSIKLLKRSN